LLNPTLLLMARLLSGIAPLFQVLVGCVARQMVSPRVSYFRIIIIEVVKGCVFWGR
jgi:hypothetical protein